MTSSPIGSALAGVNGNGSTLSAGNSPANIDIVGSTGTYNTIILLPTTPQEIGVLLPPPALRHIDFTALDFETMRRMAVEYIQTYYPNDFNDFILSNGVIMLIELTSAIGNSLSERSDILVDESFLPTAQSTVSVMNHLELIGQTLGVATPAVVDMECTVSTAVGYDVSIQPGLVFSFSGPDGSPVYYELFSAPNDYTSDLIIPRNYRGIVGFAIEGQFGTPITVAANGEANQYVDIIQTNVLASPIIVTITTGVTETTWTQVEFLQQATATDTVFQVQTLTDRTRVLFGDNVNGKIPLDGQIITVEYRQGGGVRGQIGSGIINETRPISQPQFATVSVLFRNNAPSRGGADAETLDAARIRAPAQYSVHGNAATSDDYSFLASQYSHPVYGIVAKSVAVIRSGIAVDVNTVVAQVRSAPTSAAAVQYLLGNYVNQNIIEFYILQQGSILPLAPNLGLKQALATYLSQINVFTDQILVLDGQLLPVDIDATVVISRSGNPGLVKQNVLAAITNLFALANFEMGQEFNRSDLFTAISNVSGVKSVDIYLPVDDYPSLGVVADVAASGTNSAYGVGVNQLIVLGTQNIRFYLEQGNLNV